jgi:Na+/H+ antiporter NhaD/arsenite permease-like protein
MRRFIALAAASALAFAPAHAAEGIDGATLSLLWALPFAGMLLSIAIFPMVAPKFWHHHFGKISIFWALAFAVPFGIVYGGIVSAQAVWHAIAIEYIPFIVLLYALFAVAGGILVRGDIAGTPAANTSMIAFGTLIASLLGTTGAAMLMIRPLIRANANRPRNVHVFVFFIFLVANIGGSLTPLGDPPLFLGFLQGVSFFWTTEHLFFPAAFSSIVLLTVFYFLDRWITAREPQATRETPPQSMSIQIFGGHNVALLIAIIGVVLGSSLIDPSLQVHIFGTDIGVDSIVRCAALIVIAAISIATTRRFVRIENAFNWGPIVEVALLFIGIFITIIPALAILQAGDKGALAALVQLVTRADGTPDPSIYFWVTGVLSAFLDNAPTYLVFFNLAGGDPQVLMTTMAPVLAAISGGAVFFGAATYIGNAPNFMVKTICEERGIKMPSFFGFMGWSAVVLLPLFAVNTLLFFN